MFNGAGYLWGNIAAYVISYYYHFGGSDGLGEKHLDLYYAVYYSPILTITLMFSNPLGAFLARWCPPKLLILVGNLIGVLATWFALSTPTFNWFMFLFAFVKTVGVGLCYFPPLICGWEWFEDQKGVATGVILSAYGFSSVIFSFMSLAYINPENADPDLLPDGNLIYSKEISARVPDFFKAMALSFLALGLVSVLLVKRNPEYVQSAEELQRHQLTVKEGLMTSTFYMLIMMDFLSILPLKYFASIFKTMGL